jgi:23S rRNA (guanine745-N1)-methyltransferase
MVGARARLVAAGVGGTLLDAFVHWAASLIPGDDAAVVDLGSGSGEALGALADLHPMSGIGIDLSAAAADIAARRFPSLTWVVANADRRLPLVDESVALVLSRHGRRNAAECARVLAPDGHLLVAIPAQDDLVELRERTMGQRVNRDRAEPLLAEHEPLFALVERSAFRERACLDRGGLLDLLRGTYRGERRSAANRIAALQSLEVTVACEIFLFRRRGHAVTRSTGALS